MKFNQKSNKITKRKRKKQERKRKESVSNTPITIYRTHNIMR